MGKQENVLLKVFESNVIVILFTYYLDEVLKLYARIKNNKLHTTDF